MGGVWGEKKGACEEGAEVVDGGECGGREGRRQVVLLSGSAGPGREGKGKERWAFFLGGGVGRVYVCRGVALSHLELSNQASRHSPPPLSAGDSMHGRWCPQSNPGLSGPHTGWVGGWVMISFRSEGK